MRVLRSPDLTAVTGEEPNSPSVGLAPTRNAAVAYLLALVILVADQLTKRWAEANFSDGPERIFGDFLIFRFGENSGAAFSLFQNAGRFFGLAAVVAIGFIAYALTKPRPRFEVIAFGLVIGGALGNLTDRILRGAGFLDGRVIDWIQIPYWPTFNIADSAVSIAIVTLLLGSLRPNSRQFGPRQVGRR